MVRFWACPFVPLPGTMKELLSLCPEKLHCPVPLETLIWTNLNYLAPTGTNLIWSDPIWSSLIQFEPILSYLFQFKPVLSDLIQIINLIHLDPIWSNLIQFDSIWTNFIWFELNYQSDPRLVRHLILLQTHKCSLLIMGLQTFEIKLC